MIYQIHNGTKMYGANMIFENIQFEIKNTEKIALVGRNGCGKTTLLKAIAGVEELERGEIHKMNGIRIGYLAQTTFEHDEALVKEELEAAFSHLKEMERELAKLTAKMAEDHSEDCLLYTSRCV